MTSDDHKILVGALVKAFKGEGFTISKADYEQYPRPNAIVRHEPDIIAYTPNGLVVIGEAKTAGDLSSQNSKEQFIDFSSQVMASGPLKGQGVPFHIIVNKEVVNDLRAVLNSLGLQSKMGDIIIIWTL